MEGLRLTNGSDAAGEVEVVLTFLDGKRPLATVECGVDRLRTGASGEATCIGPDTTFDDADGVLVAEPPSL